MATIAVFVSLGGTSYAAITLTGKDIRNGSLTSADIRDKSLTVSDFRPGTLPAYRFSLRPQTVPLGHSVSVGSEKGFSFSLACEAKNFDGYNGNDVVATLRGSGGGAVKDLAWAVGYPPNAGNTQMNLDVRQTATSEFKLVGQEADAQGEVALSADGERNTCSLIDGVVKVR